MVERAGWTGTKESDLTCSQDPRTRHVGPLWSNQSDSPAWVVLQLLHHLPKMATSGKAYGSRSSLGRLIVSLSILGDLAPVIQVKTVCC